LTLLCVTADDGGADGAAAGEGGGAAWVAGGGAGWAGGGGAGWFGGGGAGWAVARSNGTITELAERRNDNAANFVRRIASLIFQRRSRPAANLAHAPPSLHRH